LNLKESAVFILWEIARKNNIIPILDSIFPERKRDGQSRGKFLLLAAIQRAISPGSKREFSEWASGTSLPSIADFDSERLTSQHFWDQMDGIDEEMLTKAENEITSQIFKNYHFSISRLALDYTNYFSFIATDNERNKIAQRGHNKQKRNDLRQYSLALITTKELMLPLCSYVYEGNINDVTVFPSYINKMKERLSGFNSEKEITIIFDKGSNSKANFDEVEQLGFMYICGFSLNQCKKLIEIPLTEYLPVKVNGKDILTHRKTAIVSEKERECVLLFSSKLKAGLVRGLKKELAGKKEKLDELKKQLNNPKSNISRDSVDIKGKITNIISGNHGPEIITVLLTGESVVQDIDVSLNGESFHRVCEKYFGKKLLITNQDKWATEEIISSYFGQSDIEKIFKHSKNPDHFAVRPQFHWTDNKMRVHIFVCLLGLMLTSLLRKEFVDSGIKIENARILDLLSQIRETIILKPNSKNKSGFEVKKTLEEMTEEQRKIWETAKKFVKS
jgi:transposase